MRPGFLVAGFAALFAAVGAGQPVAAQCDQPSIDLVVHAGRPLRVALDERIRLTSVGQIVTGTVTEPVYAYDRIVIAVGTKVRGHVSQIEIGSKFVRARAYMGGNFSPAKHAVLQFDTLLLDDGSETPIGTVVRGGIPNVTRTMAGGSTFRKAPVASNDDEKRDLQENFKVSASCRRAIGALCKSYGMTKAELIEHMIARELAAAKRAGVEMDVISK